MISKWTVSNFKSIKSETELELAPLTIFAGANSSGKSTLIQSLLLVAQTLSDPVKERVVVLNGSLVNLGQFKDLQSHGTGSDEITIKCSHYLDTRQLNLDRLSRLRSTQKEESTSSKRVEVTFEFAFEAGIVDFANEPSGEEYDVFQIRPRLKNSRLTYRSIEEQNKEDYRYISLDNAAEYFVFQDGEEIELDDDFFLETRPELPERVGTDPNSLSEVIDEYESGSLSTCSVEHFLPSEYVCRVDLNKEIAKAVANFIFDNKSRFGRSSILKNLKHESDFAMFKFVFWAILPVSKEFENSFAHFRIDNFFLTLGTVQSSFFRWWNGLTKEQHLKIREHCKNVENIEAAIYKLLEEKKIYLSPKYVLVDLPDELEISRLYLKNHFESYFKYLGPLRETPKSIYPIKPSITLDDIGVQGENTASILEVYKDKKIQFIPAERFSTPTVDAQPVWNSLNTAVNDWLRYVGIATGVESQYKGKFGHELIVYGSKSGGNSDLTHVGVGVSQVLPILVICLLAERGSTIVLEQPELHLHPKVQSLLGDFFLSMALCGKQCIIETHSEYLVDRLRFRIAADPIEKSSFEDKVKIYFVEQNSEGSSQFQAVDVNEYGSILDWPDGFFDESQRQSEEILRAAYRKQQAKEKK